MKIGDIVARKSYNRDIIFKIVGFNIDSRNEKYAILKGIAFRIIADSYLDDLEVVNPSDIKDILIDKKDKRVLMHLQLNNQLILMFMVCQVKFFKLMEIKNI